ncbi:hypothetical protein CXF86_15365 [Shewanella sp. GutCb]|uniref:S8 family serine peptidase n=1 Tax=Shewanella sp. GutCb TaxID=2058315 RepID=UPI000C7CD0C4|nr:S8 family serine peptidase [Shewanella sp. GutCb]PKG74062.1 hypothetical protein CXF86_15365 [Shewanella sp. GutCb]
MKISLFSTLAMVTSISISANASDLIVNWKDGVNVHKVDAIAEIAEQTGLNIQLIKPLQSTFDLIKVSGDGELAVTTLLNSGSFTYVELSGSITLPNPTQEAINPSFLKKKEHGDAGTLSFVVDKFNDPLYLQEEHLDEQESGRMGLSNILKARDYAVAHNSFDGKVRVAVLDTGKFEHEDINWSEDEASFLYNDYAKLCSKIDKTNQGGDLVCAESELLTQVNNNDATDKLWSDEGDGVYRVAINGHGLKVASQIAAIANNGVGMVGIVPHNSVEIIPVKVLGHRGAGGISGIADGIYWSLGLYDNGSLSEGDSGYVAPISAPVDIINLSLGGKSTLSCETNGYMKSAIEKAYEMNVSVVIAAGNEATDTTYVTPANCGGAFVVTSNSLIGELSDFGNYGQFVDVSVIGEQITTAAMSTAFYGTDANCGVSDTHDDCYTFSTGTSMSTPNAVGILALLKLVHPDLSAKEREAMVLNTSKRYELNSSNQATRASKLGYGAGVANAYNAMFSDALSVGDSTIKHRYENYDSTVDAAYVATMLTVIPNACGFYNIEFGTIQHAVEGISYKVMQTNKTGSIDLVNFDKVITTQLPKALVDMTDYSRLAIQSCKNGACGEIAEIDLSQTEAPSICGD